MVFGLVGCSAINIPQAENYFQKRPIGELCLYMTGKINNEYSRSPAGMEVVTKEFNTRNVDVRDCPEIARKYTYQKKQIRLERERQYAIYQKKQKEEAAAQKLKQEEEKRRQIAQAQQAQYNAYINQKKATCKSYGYSESNGMAQCVEREINAERARLNAQAAQQNRINQENFQRQQQGLRDLADIFGKMGEGNYGQQQQEKPKKVCVYICDFETVTTTDSICPYQITYKGSVCYQD